MAVFGIASTLGRAIGVGSGVGLGGCLSAVHRRAGVLHVESRRGGQLGEGRHGGGLGAMSRAEAIKPVREGRQKEGDWAVALGGGGGFVVGISVPWPRVLAQWR